jgi:hypothetical protein
VIPGGTLSIAATNAPTVLDQRGIRIDRNVGDQPANRWDRKYDLEQQPG